ncbi:MAG TPA: hypothetical protein VND24_08840, partial [Steroidobacteraceae bacterium]|nr:hypothetical protein [Steroidobacteraceae bacterium]
LRDDPGVVNPASVDTHELPPTPEEAERASARHAAANAPEDGPPKPTPARVGPPKPPAPPHLG